jgi:hypothetical protein
VAKGIEDEVIGILIIPACSILLVSRRRSALYRRTCRVIGYRDLGNPACGILLVSWRRFVLYRRTCGADIQSGNRLSGSW